LQFWATWCPYCKRDMPALERIGQEFESGHQVRAGKLAGRQEGAGGEGSLRHLLRKAALDSREDPGDSFQLESSPRRQ